MGENLPSWGLVLVRILVGGILGVKAWFMLKHGVGEELVRGTRDAYAASPGIVKSWGEAVVLVHPWFFSKLAVFGALVGGACLFLGALTRPFGYLLAFLLANVFFVTEGTEQVLALLLCVCCLACAMSRAGMRSGADVFLLEKLPSWMTWMRA
ncbi:MAG: hypothetical protein IPJ19_00645 [Planctomycetes bacterium]|nr:hypothetical protein [Planctomycetota bacterium]